ncbi:MAG: DUF3793 family protein [Oscillospiraceae bacterium]|nr:DUF3793 family protein [Oscillospiraceae bacterium]
MPEDLIVQQCSPTLAGLKTGSLFTCPFRTEAELRADIAALNRRLAPKGVNVRILRVQKRALLYLYRPSSLRRDFASAEVAMLLRQYGYTVDDAEACLARLCTRLNGASDFPHEIGLFLGYPAEDVRGFIENRREGCKCVGTWKVYGDERAARRRFAQYEKCTRIYQTRFSEGRSIERLTVSS